MKEANIFEAWIDNLAEGTWATPDTPEKQQQLIELLSKEFPVGPDATNATEQLYDLLGDDELFDQLETLSTTDPDADCRQVVIDRMDMLSNDPDIQAVVAKLQIDPAATMNPAEPTDAGMSANPKDAQIPTNEEDLEDVVSIGGDSSDEFMSDIMTNQQGDEIQESELESILRIAGVPAEKTDAVDYEPEVKEGAIENVVGDTLSSDNEETDECYSTAGIAPEGGAPLESALQGQYGHSGKMKEVSKHTNFLDRLKELSGMMRSDKI